MTTPLKIIFAGTPDFAAGHLQALLASEHEVVAVYSQPDRPAGRGKKLQASPVKQLALEHDIPVYQPISLKTPEAQSEFASIQADIMVVVAYGLILPKVILDTPRLGCINVHGSLLPKWRGAAPIQRSIWAGDKVSGVTIMQMDEGLDSGAMLLKHEVVLAKDETSASLYAKLEKSGPQALIDTLLNLENISPEQQSEADVTYAKKLTKEEAKIDWQTSAVQIERNIRAFNPWPVAFFEHQEQAIKVWAADVVDIAPTQRPGTILQADKHGILVATGNQGLLITQLQLPGKKAMASHDVLNSRADWFIPGTHLK